MGLLSGYESVANAAIPQYGLNTQSMGFMDYLGKGIDTLGGYASKGFDWANKNSQGLGALGGLAGSYMQYDMGQDMYKLQKDAYNYNKMLSDREKKRQEEAEQAFALGFKNSTLGA
jgi:hypothetical protein